jgi:hypothetical protein
MQGPTCNDSGCHKGSDYQSSLTYDGLLTVEPNQSIDMNLLHAFDTPINSGLSMAGINISVSGGVLGQGSGLQKLGDELTHTFSSLARLPNNEKDWHFTWTAPETEGTVTLYACAEAVDRTGTQDNDDASAACIQRRIAVQKPVTPEPPAPPTGYVRADVDGDGIADVSLWRPSNQTFYSYSLVSKSLVINEIVGSDEYGVPLIGDVDGNGQDDLVLWSPASGLWDIRFDSGQRGSFRLGQAGDYPFLGDVDGDGRADPIVRRPGSGAWYYLASASGDAERTVSFGNQSADEPVLGDYDGDGKIDFAVKRGKTWYIQRSSDGVIDTRSLGPKSEDVAVPADYDGDGLTDVAIWRPSNGTWYIYYSSDGVRRDRSFGKQTVDVPVPADYDGDGKVDLAVRRLASSSLFYISSASGSNVSHVFAGQSTDIPASAAWVSQQTLILTQPTVVKAIKGDVDGDGRADYSVWRPSSQSYYVKSSGSEELILSRVLGSRDSGVPLMGDIDGDGQSDTVVWQPESGQWEVGYADGDVGSFSLGQAGDYPFLEDADGDGKDDLIIRRPSNSTWYYLASSNAHEKVTVAYGNQSTDVPVLGDYDGDGKIDFAVKRGATWYIQRSSDGATETRKLGPKSDDVPVPADYDGDGITDVAIWRPSNGTWYVYYSSDGVRYDKAFGRQSVDAPVPADYDGDGKVDLAVRRAGTATFFYVSSDSGNLVMFGFGGRSTDIPVLGAWLSQQSLITPPVAKAVKGDVDGDGRADYLIWRPANQGYYGKSSDSELLVVNTVIGARDNGVPLVGDVDGDGQSDVVVWQPETGLWEIAYADGDMGQFFLGVTGDYPFLEDADGDGKDDPIIRRPDTASWHYLASSNGHEETSVVFGNRSTDIPVLGYYDDDNQVDFAVKRGATWYIRRSSDGVMETRSLGPRIDDVAVPADYDGDGLTDVAIWRPSNGTWYIDYSSTGERYSSIFGKQPTDIPTPADYDGDGKADLAVRRPVNYTFYYLGSDTGSVSSLGVGRKSTDIPTLAAWQLQRNFWNEAADVDGFFNDNVSAQIVQSKCVACHTDNGAAAASRLQFERSNVANYQAVNNASWQMFVNESDVNVDYVLSKTQGLLSHGGAQQLVFGSDEYAALAEYLGLMTGEEVITSSEGFWNGVGLLSHKQTLRKAALIVAGRLPTEEEYASIADNKETSLKAAIRGLMQGDGFHQFLTDGANDKLLTYKFLQTGGQFLDPNGSRLPAGATLAFEARKAGGDVLEEHWSLHNTATKSFAKAAPELIAYIVENEKPYSEILTANYTMVNPRLDEYYRADANFNNPSDQAEMVPAQIKGFMLEDETFTSDYTETFGLEIFTEGPNITWPHAGILNDPAFLERYPSTATNRNRARSRWAQYFFLDFDIEKSAARTTDPDALADTDNPTMKNPNCTVCHETLDPIAGAFQNYGDVGYYRDQWGGKDSLPDTYKWPEKDDSSPYQQGDTWYRDMRAPGFKGEAVPDSDTSLQWLAQKIVNNDRFAISAVKFWWPAIIGSAAVDAPEVSSDNDYDSKKAVYSAQSLFIDELANSLRSHMNLKDAFVDVIMSEWFRNNSMTEDAFELHSSNKSGKGRLLSPELLDRKTKAVMGLSWGEHYPEWNDYQRRSSLQDDYKLTYGGIDSDGVITRSEEMTAIMSQLALTHAAEMACEVVVNDFIKSDEEKLLFKGMTKSDSPDLVEYEIFSFTNHGPSTSAASTISVSIEKGNHILNISFLNDWADFETLHVDRNLMIDKVTIKKSDGSVFASYEGGEIDVDSDTQCAGPRQEDETGNDLSIYSSCNPIEIPLTIDEAGVYSIEVWAYGALHDEYDGSYRYELEDQFGDFSMGISVNLENFRTQNSTNITKIKQAIVTLVERSWGEFLTPEHEEIEVIYQLYIQSWENKKSLDGWNTHIAEDWVDCSFPFWEYNRPEDNYDGWILGEDPQAVMSAWRTVILYVMTDYRYLHE